MSANNPYYSMAAAANTQLSPVYTTANQPYPTMVSPVEYHPVKAVVSAPVYPSNDIAIVLVLFVLLVIILKMKHHHHYC